MECGNKLGAGEAEKVIAVCTLAVLLIGILIGIFSFVGTIGGAVLGAQYCTGKC
ncbi:hypothetical protein STRUR_1670 [Streptococcus urinalis 2285-97]|uniref:Uncharacterized protein n=1 Tax=Streptococcus urinalis 2285-97 TaxID=764291 RepID=G5KIF9_9STRE|nr:hypothetical protein STRUR_1670 [Streptococcus urinalis 2285-97]